MPNQATTFAAARAENYAWVNADESHFAETVTQWPLGASANAVSVPGVVVHLDAEGEQPVDDREGSQVVRWCELSIPILAAAGVNGNQPAVTITVDARSQTRDQFLVRGELWHAEKIVRRTPYRVRLRCKRREAAATTKTRTR